MTSTRRRRLGALDVAGLIGASLLGVGAAAFVATREPASVINIRWTAAVDADARAAGHRRYALTRCRPQGERTESCDLLDTTARNIQAILSDPGIEDTHHLDRERLAVSGSGDSGETMTWIALRFGYVRPWMIDALLVMAAAIVVVAGGRRVWMLALPAVRAWPGRARAAWAIRRGAALAAIPRFRDRVRALSASPARLALVVVALALVATQCSAVVVEFNRYATDSGRLRAFDEDSALAIEVTQRTRWYNDNGFRFYGPMYYRIGHSVESLLPMAADGRRSHLALLLTSLVAMYGISLALVIPMAMSWPMRLLAAALVGAAFLHDPVWKEMLFRAHNDWLLSGCATLLAVGLFLLRRRPGSWRYLSLAALALALGLLTKFIFLFFVPSVALLFLTHRALRRRLFAMAVLTIAGYVVLGAPQSLQVGRDIAYLQSLASGYSQPADAGAVREWFSLIRPQLLWPAGALVLSWLLLSRRDGSPREHPHWAAAALEGAAIAAPFALLMSRTIASADHYYPMPFVGFALGGIAVMLAGQRLPWARAARLPIGAFALIGTALVATGRLVPRDLGSLLAAEAPCRPEAERVHGFLDARGRQGDVVFMDPFVPRPADPALADRWKGSYVNNWRYFAEAQPDWFATYAGHARVYLGSRPDYVNIWTTDAAASESFYRAFAGRDRVTSPDGRTLTLHEQFGCGWQVWKVE